MIATATRTSALWRPCPICWGQRRIFQDRNREGLVPHTCHACFGVGETLVSTG